MRAELRAIESDRTLDWETFAAAETEKPWDDYETFTLSIGPEGESGTELFRVLVATHAASCRLQSRGQIFRGIVVDEFLPEVIEKTLSDFVSSFDGKGWSQLVEQLRTVMDWEYEGMDPVR